MLLDVKIETYGNC